MGALQPFPPHPFVSFFAATLSSSTHHPPFSHLLSLSLSLFLSPVSLSPVFYLFDRSATKRCAFESLIKIFSIIPLIKSSVAMPATWCGWTIVAKNRGVKSWKLLIAISVYSIVELLKCAFQGPSGVQMLIRYLLLIRTLEMHARKLDKTWLDNKRALYERIAMRSFRIFRENNIILLER